MAVAPRRVYIQAKCFANTQIDPSLRNNKTLGFGFLILLGNNDILSCVAPGIEYRTVQSHPMGLTGVPGCNINVRGTRYDASRL